MQKISMPPIWPHSGAIARADTSSVPLFLLLLSLVFAISVYLLFQWVRNQREAQRSLTSVNLIGRAFTNAPIQQEELLEIAYIEAARLFETDFFQVGLFDGDRYRTLLWVRDGDRIPNQAFKLDRENAGLVGWVKQSGEALLVEDFKQQSGGLPAQPSYEDPNPPRAAMFVPLRMDAETFGVALVQSRTASAFNGQDLARFEALANLLAPALRASEVQVEVDNRTRQLIILHEISRRLGSLLPIEDRLQQVSALLLTALPLWNVRVYESQAEDLVLRSLQSRSKETALSGSPSNLVQRCLESGEIVRGRVQVSPDQGSPGDRGPFEIAIPLKVEARMLGVLNVFAAADFPAESDPIRLMELIAGQIALAVLESRNYAQQQEQAWVTTVLLEVARHAAQPGDPEVALQAVLQLTTLLTGTNWALLLLPSEAGSELRLGPSAGLRRRRIEPISSIDFERNVLGLPGPYTLDADTTLIDLPEPLAAQLEASKAVAMTLSDGHDLLGVLLLEEQDIQGRALSLLGGIAHQISLRLENTRLIDEAAAKRSLEREITVAREIQASFLPELFPEHPGWEVGAIWIAAREVSGDFYDFIPLPPGENGPRWGIVIADVSDKGVPAALYMALCRTLIRSVATAVVDPGLTLERVNRLLITDSKSKLFVSAVYAVWEPHTGTIHYANAGHNPPLLFTPETQARKLQEHGMVLGVLPDQAYACTSVQLEPGQLLLLYTDGVTEAFGGRQEMFGTHRLEHLVLGMPEWNGQEIANRIATRVLDFTRTREPSDDLTTVVLRYMP